MFFCFYVFAYKSKAFDAWHKNKKGLSFAQTFLHLSAEK
jgi:hypothetical protein